jgi:microcystin-dependent protein
MTDAFLGELKLFALHAAELPAGWAPCDGSVLQITSVTQPLASVIGNRYGGDGRSTFALPDLRGATPGGFGPGYAQGEATHVLFPFEVPAHQHAMQATNVSASDSVPNGAVLGAAANLYADPGSLVALHPDSVSPFVGNKSHENMQPYLVLTWCICTDGVPPNGSGGSTSVTTGEIRMYAGRYELPVGWLFCHGQQLSQADNQPLFGAIREQFGGDASTFNVPDMRGRVPLHTGRGLPFGRSGGSEMVKLAPDELPSHRHTALATTTQGTSPNPGGHVLAASPSLDMYVQEAPTAPLAAESVGESFPDPNRQVQPHENRQPYAVTNFMIATDAEAPGKFPGEVRAFAFDGLPDGWLACSGTLVETAACRPLYGMIGVTYGSRGTDWFGLPNFVQRVPVGTGLGPGQSGPENDGQPYDVGAKGGEVSVSLTDAQIPSHDHRLLASALAADLQSPGSDRSLGRSNGGAAYVPMGTADAQMAPSAISPADGDPRPGQDPIHLNMMPTVGFTFGISTG